MGSDFLFVYPSLLTGAGSVVDLWGNPGGYNASPSGAVADRAALRADWSAVGQDLRETMEKTDPAACADPAEDTSG